MSNEMVYMISVKDAETICKYIKPINGTCNSISVLGCAHFTKDYIEATNIKISVRMPNVYTSFEGLINIATLDKVCKMYKKAKKPMFDLKEAESKITVDKFPELPSTKEQPILGKFLIAAGDVNWKGLNIACSDDETRYFMNGLAFAEGNLVSTDGRRLHIQYEAFPPFEKKIVPIISKHFINLIPPKTDVLFKFTTNEVTRGSEIITNVYCTMLVNGIAYITSSIEGQFPNYTRVIPENINQLAPINVADLKMAYDKLKIITEGRKPIMRLGLKVPKETGDSGKIELVPQPAHLPIDESLSDFAINAEYLLDAALLLGSEETLMMSWTQGEYKRAVSFDSLDSKIRAIVMPMCNEGR